MKYDFFTCLSCGKERQRPVLAPAPGYRTLLENSSCRACETLVMMELDLCPESFNSEDGSSFGSCSKTWNHKGRCEPHKMLPSVLKRILKAEHGE